MPRSWSSSLGCVLLFSFLVIFTIAAPVQASATVLSTATSRIGSSLADCSSRYVDGVGDQRSAIVAVSSEALTGSRLIMAAESMRVYAQANGTRLKATSNNVPAGQPKEGTRPIRAKFNNVFPTDVQKKSPGPAAKPGSAPKQKSDANSALGSVSTTR